jgi:AraC family transcriptional regulator, transcriptional activator of the genes for pyochelin and ferripyochelin receptors
MTFAISKSDYDALWAASNYGKYSSAVENNAIDFTYQCPHELGLGYEQWVNLRGISLLIINQKFKDDLLLKYSTNDFDVEDECSAYDRSQENKNIPNVEFGFNLLGNCCSKNPNLSFLELGEEEDDEEEMEWEGSVGKRLLKVDMHLNLDLLRTFATQISTDFPKKLQGLLDRTKQGTYEEIGKLTLSMKSALQQIIHCPFQGMMRQMYLEAKCLELMALKLTQIAELESEHEDWKEVKPNQIDQIYQAREILVRDLGHPPSLLDLARQVGLNDCDLKRGFRQIFNTTVFGYLHACRMTEAKRLLEMQNLNINDVARAIGYKSRSTFSAAFKKKFGVSPSNCI